MPAPGWSHLGPVHFIVPPPISTRPPTPPSPPPVPGWRYLGPLDDQSSHASLHKVATIMDLPPYLMTLVLSSAFPVENVCGTGRQAVRDLFSLIAFAQLCRVTRATMVTSDGNGWLDELCRRKLRSDLGVGRPKKYADKSHQYIAARTIDMYARNDGMGPYRATDAFGGSRDVLCEMIMGTEVGIGRQWKPCRYRLPMDFVNPTDLPFEEGLARPWNAPTIKKFFHPADLEALPARESAQFNTVLLSSDIEGKVVSMPRLYADPLDSPFAPAHLVGKRNVNSTANPPPISGDTPVQDDPLPSPQLVGRNSDPSVNYPPMGFATCPPVQKLEIYFGAEFYDSNRRGYTVVPVGLVVVENKEGVTLMDVEEKYQAMLNKPNTITPHTLWEREFLYKPERRDTGSFKAELQPTLRESMTSWLGDGIEAFPFAISGKTAIVWKNVYQG